MLSAASASYPSSSKRHPVVNGYTSGSSSNNNGSSASWQRRDADGGQEEDNPESRRGQIIGSSSRFLSSLRASASSDAASVLPSSSFLLHSTAPVTSSAAVFSPPSAAKVPGLLKALIVDICAQEQRRLHRSASLSAAQIESLRSYSLRLLSSRLAAPRAAASSAPLLQLVDLIQHEVAASGSGDAVYAAELLQRFVRREGVREKTAVLHLLYACRQRRQRAHSHLFSLPITAPPAFPLPPTAAPQRSDSQQSERKAARFRDEREDEADDSSRTQQLSRDVSLVRRPVTGGGRERPADSVPESELMRDILFAFQGVDGQLLRFDSASLSYRLSASASQLIPPPRQRLISRICQLGALYRLVCSYVNRAMERGSATERKRQQQHRITAAARPQPEALKAAGLIEQSFVGAVQSELSEYLRWVAVMESRLLQSPESLSLHRLYVASQPPLSRLALLASLTSSASASHGGALLTAVYAHFHHGSPAVQSLVRRVLSASCAPLVLLIQRWIGQGEIHDPHLEFFVAVEQAVPAARLWSDRYRLRRSMLPAFISPQLAQQILVIGKSVNFIRECCHDGAWEAHTNLDLAALFAAPESAAASASTLSASTSAAASASSSSSSSLLRDVSQCASLTNAHLLSLLLDRYQFLLHARALKSYLLLSAGDFIQSLLSLLQPELHKPASAVNSRHLLSLVDQAVRASNARFDSPEVLRRLSVKLLRAQDAGGDTGWDVFSLDYSLDAPLSIVLTPASLAVYLRLFSFLFRLKRVEWEMSAVWMRQSTHRFVLDRALGGLPVYDGLRRVLRSSHALRQEMSHLLLNVSSYLMLQVMETSWETFEKELKAAREMDDLIRCHAAYVQAIADKALLSGVAAPLSALLLPLFDDCLRFTRMQATLYDEALKEVAKRQTYSLQVSKQQHQQHAVSADSSRRPSVDDSRGRAVSAADAYAATAGALLDSGVFVSELPRWEEELQRLTTRFHLHLYTFLNALDLCIEKAQSSGSRQQQQQQQQHAASAASSAASSSASTPQAADDHIDASPLLGPPLAGPVDCEQRGTLPSLSSSSSSYVAELEFLRLRLDFNDFYLQRKAQPSLILATAQPSAGGVMTERADAAAAAARAPADSTKRAVATPRSSGATAAMGGSVAVSRAAAKSVTSTGDLPPRPRAAAARRAQHHSDDDSSGRE